MKYIFPECGDNPWSLPGAPTGLSALASTLALGTSVYNQSHAFCECSSTAGNNAGLKFIGAQMNRKLALLLSMLLLLLMIPGSASAQAWSGILDPTRAANWQRSNVGVSGGIPTNYTQCGSTIEAYSGTSSTINNAIAKCPARTFVLLGPGTFNLSNSISIKNSKIILRGSGPNLTKLVFSGAGAGGAFSGTIYVSPSFALSPESAPVQPGGQNAANWIGGYTQGTTSITLTKVGTSGILNGDVIILDQINDAKDNGGYMVCDENASGGFICMAQGVANHNTGRVIGGIAYAQQQFVKVTAGCASACIGSGPFNITISPGLYETNWNGGGRAVGAWFVKPVDHIGVENLSIDASACPDDISCQSGITFFDVDQGWVKNVSVAKTRRNHVWFANTSRMELRDSYLIATKNAASQSYGLECYVCDDSLVENNILQQTAGGIMLAGGAGNVFAYNFGIDEVQSPSGFEQTEAPVHSDGSDMNLYEGNEFDSIIADQLHGTSGKFTIFRNWLSGRGYNTVNGALGNQPTTQTFPIDLNSYVRGVNIIGNVLGTPGYHTTENGGVYENFPTTNDLGSEGISPTRCNHSIYNLGWGQGECANFPSQNVLNDPRVLSTLMRWGNYDTVTSAVRWDSTESSPTATTYLSANPTPASHTLPPSMYLSGRPTFWGTMPFPAVGPDVNSGSGPGGFAYDNPAAVCYFTVMNGPADGSGNPLPFDANNCYGGSLNPPPAAPTNLSVVVQ
jgi:hypothetical protein